ncbi:MAG: PPA1309 family protein [Micrococcales bacterium]|nr:PPA1309 family protein [Micrococcales bacterium]
MTESRPVTDLLAITALDTERYVAGAGWDQNPRLFALVDTAELMEREPHLREQMSGPDLMPGALTALEQDDLPPTSHLESFLGRLSWPEAVMGVALAVERIVVPPEAERGLPEDPEKAVEALAAHPQREDVRLLVAVHRDGRSICLLRQRAHDSDDQVAMGSDIAPGLVHALRATLQD